MRIRRITLSTLASHYCDQSLLAHRHIIPLSSPSSPHAPPFITSLAYHFVSPSRTPNTHHNRARISHYSRGNIRATRRRRRNTSWDSRAKVRVRCRFWPAYSSITVQPEYGPGSIVWPVDSRWLLSASAFTALSRRCASDITRIMHPTDRILPYPSRERQQHFSISFSVSLSLSLSFSLSLSLSLSATSTHMPSSSLYRHVRSIDQPPYCTRNVMHTCVYMYIHIQYEYLCVCVCVYRCIYTTASKRRIDACSDVGDWTSHLGRRDRIFGTALLLRLPRCDDTQRRCVHVNVNY